MPGIDGWALLTQLKRMPHTARIPVIVCSVVDEASRALVLGASDYLLKPLAEDDLLRSLQSIGIPLHRIAGMEVLLVGEELTRVEEHLRSAGAKVTRVVALEELARKPELQPDVGIFDLSMATPEQIAALSDGDGPSFPVLALIDDAERAPRWLQSLTQLATREALERDRLVRAVHEAARRQTTPEWYAGTGLPGPSSLLGHLRTSAARAAFDKLSLAIAIADIAVPSSAIAAPWVQLLFQRLRQTDFLAVATERRLVLVVHGAAPDDAPGIQDRFRSLLTMVLGLDVRAVRMLERTIDAQEVEALFEEITGPDA
jgi:CheY-like chemotaxis protein